MESNGEMDVALKYYEAANDILSLVRVYCFCGNIEKVSLVFNMRSIFTYCMSSDFKLPKTSRCSIQFRLNFDILKFNFPFIDCQAHMYSFIAFVYFYNG
jgi:hypothetical protein